MQKRVLNVGGNDIKVIPMPGQYKNWKQEVLDIDPNANPDICCDARDMLALEGNSYDAIYCSHNLEHYYPHEVPKVLQGFIHVLKKDGFLETYVPDVMDVMQKVIKDNLDIDDVLYTSSAGPILVRDVLYGYHVEIEQSGNDFFAHKTGFSPRSFEKNLALGGFNTIMKISRGAALEIGRLAFKCKPNEDQQKMFGFKYS